MSNVLIGIIGVVLFIGLAVAAAMFLGPRFQDATNNSRAMSLTQMDSQIVSAAILHKQEQHEAIVARTPTLQLKVNGYLKSVPLNPLIDRGGFPFRLLYSGDIESSSYYADMVFVSLGGSEDALSICKAVNRHAFGGEVISELPISVGADVSSGFVENAGCFRMHDVGVPGEANPHDYVVYSRL